MERCVCGKHDVALCVDCGREALNGEIATLRAQVESLTAELARERALWAGLERMGLRSRAPKCTPKSRPSSPWRHPGNYESFPTARAAVDAWTAANPEGKTNA